MCTMQHVHMRYRVYIRVYCKSSLGDVMNAPAPLRIQFINKWNEEHLGHWEPSHLHLHPVQTPSVSNLYSDAFNFRLLFCSAYKATHKVYAVTEAETAYQWRGSVYSF